MSEPAPKSFFESKIYSILASVFILAILVLQSSTIVAYVMGKPMETRYWPIVDYPMYVTAHYENEPLKAEYQLYGFTEDGVKVDISAESLGIGFWDYWHITKRLAREVVFPPTYQVLAEIVPNYDQLVRLELYDYPAKITRNGPEYKAPDLVKEIDLIAVRNELEGARDE